MNNQPDKKVTEKTESTPDRTIVTEESIALLKAENIITALKTYNDDTAEKEIASEFVKSFKQFLLELADHDMGNEIKRSNFEIKDLVSHVNMMMKEKDEYLFSVMVMTSHIHYETLQKSLLQKEGEEEEGQ